MNRRLTFAALAAVAAASSCAAEPRRITREALEDKIRGGWAGQMIGVAYGAPTEFQALGRINDAEIAWSPDLVGSAIDQDDLYVEMTFAEVMDRVGLEATDGAVRRDVRSLEVRALACQRRGSSQPRPRASPRRFPATPGTTSTPTTSTSRSRPTSSA